MNMKFIDIPYFSKKENICFDDISNSPKIESINPLEISSISQIEEFILPFSGRPTGSYTFYIRMTNGDSFHIKGCYYKQIKEQINKI